MQIKNNPLLQICQSPHERFKRDIAIQIALLLLVFFPFTIYAQQAPDAVSNAPLAEKIYLQTDRQVYSPNDTIWFKCIATSALTHKPTSLSGVLYVELISPTKKISQKKLIKLTEGLGSGYFGIGTGAAEGTSQLRAYTQWNLNFGTDFIFTQQISVLSTSRQNGMPPISWITLVKTQDGKQQLKACFNPLSIDSLHDGKLTVYCTVNSQTDSLRIGKGNNGQYWLEQNIDDSCRFVTLKMQTDNMANFSKTVLIDKDYTDLQFFPESGELVHGLPSKVGFKVLDINGKGVFIKGDVVDQNDSLIATFESNALGMGSFVIPVADKSKTYYARMASKLDQNNILLLPLPGVNPVGNTLSVEKRGDKLLLIAASNYLDNVTFNLFVSCRGMVYFNQKVALEDGVWGGSIPASMLPDGIIAFTMLDNTGQPVAERLFFNQRPEERLHLELATEKGEYAKREKTNLSIKTASTSGEPVDASLSVLVINKDQLGELQSKRQNILSYFLLGSELKGEIENPGFYFDGASTLEDLDALMLTQGWRKYLYTKPYEELPFKPEKGLTITGGVTNGLFQKEKMSKLTMMSFGDGFQAISSMTDSAGRFCFVLDEEYGDKMEVIIQSANVDGENKDYMVTLDQKKTPPVNFGQTSAITQLDSTVFELVRKEEERRQVEEAFRATSGTIMIGQVDVDGYKRSAMSNRIIKLAGKPDLVMDGEVLQEEEQDWSYGLFSELDFASDNLNIDILQDSTFAYRAVVRGIDNETLVLVDGEYEPLFQDLIAFIPIREVSSVDVIKYADNFELIWAETVGTLPPWQISSVSIININTVRGKGIGDVLNKFKGINRFMIPVFSTPKEYYTPNYKTMKPEEVSEPDLRSVLHWQPLLSTNSLGAATTSFYNADNVGNMTIVVEAISKDGRIGYTEMEYKVVGVKVN